MTFAKNFPGNGNSGRLSQLPNFHIFNFSPCLCLFCLSVFVLQVVSGRSGSWLAVGCRFSYTDLPLSGVGLLLIFSVVSAQL